MNDSQVGGAIVNVDGRDAVITGTVISESRSKEIEKIIAGLSGIRIVDNQLEIAKPDPVIETPKAEITSEPAPEPEVALAPENKTRNTTRN